MAVRYVGEQLPLHQLSHQQLAVVGLGGRVMIMMISGHDESVKPQSRSELEKHA